MGDEIKMKKEAFEHLLVLSSGAGQEYIRQTRPHSAAELTEDYIQARNEWCALGLCEADFDGKLHPTQEMARLIYLLDNVKAVMKSDKGKMYLSTPINVLCVEAVDGLVEICDSDYISFQQELYDFQQTSDLKLCLWTKELSRELQIHTSDEDASDKLGEFIFEFCNGKLIDSDTVNEENSGEKTDA